ncbi:MAG: hypoxanthine phosphoribosyltransferase [Pirellulaceae bacterium]
MVRTLITENQLQTRVQQLAAELNRHYHRRPLTALGVMTGSLVLLADLIRLLEMPLRVGVMQARSYRGGDTTAGDLALNLDMMPVIAGRDVLIVDDIFDTGRTLERVLADITPLGPASMRTLVLLNKTAQNQVAIRPDYVGFEIPSEFVVGYGLDYQDEYRNLPCIASLEPHEIGSPSL